MFDPTLPEHQAITPDEVRAQVERFEVRCAEFLRYLDRGLALRAAAEFATRDLGLDLAWLAEPTEDNRLEVRHLVGARTDLLWHVVVPVGWGMTGKAFELGRIHSTENYLISSSITHHFDYIAQAEQIGRAIAAPVVVEGRVIAVLTAAAHAPGEIGGVVMSGLEAAVRQAALAVSVAERSALRSEVAVQDERRQIALDLHDSVGALLFSMGVRLRELHGAVRHDPSLAEQAAGLESQAAQAAAALRQSVEALNAPPEQVQLPAAMRADCREFTARTGIPARLVPLSAIPPLDQARVQALVAAVREALVNIEKHAEARSVVVTFGQVSTGVVVAVTDDGVGLRPEQTGTGLGLAAMTDRLARVGGQLDISTNEDGGVTLRGWVPA